MNLVQSLSVAAAALVVSGEPVLQPLIDAPTYLARAEAMLCSRALYLEARFSRGDSESRQARAIPDAEILAIRHTL